MTIHNMYAVRNAKAKLNENKLLILPRSLSKLSDVCPFSFIHCFPKRGRLYHAKRIKIDAAAERNMPEKLTSIFILLTSHLLLRWANISYSIIFLKNNLHFVTIPRT